MRAKSDGPWHVLERRCAWRVPEPATVCHRQGVSKLGFEQDHRCLALCQRSRSRRRFENSGSRKIQTCWRGNDHFCAARQHPNCHCQTAIGIKSTSEIEIIPTQASPNKGATSLKLLERNMRTPSEHSDGVLMSHGENSGQIILPCRYWLASALRFLAISCCNTQSVPPKDGL